MADLDPGDQIDTLRARFQEGDHGGSVADRERLLEMSDNMRLIPSESGDHRHLKLLQHCTRVSEQVDAGDLPMFLRTRRPPTTSSAGSIGNTITNTPTKTIGRRCGRSAGTS
jgi:hypothetical protein